MYSLPQKYFGDYLITAVQGAEVAECKRDIKLSADFLYFLLLVDIVHSSTVILSEFLMLIAINHFSNTLNCNDGTAKIWGYYVRAWLILLVPRKRSCHSAALVTGLLEDQLEF